jgi:hypothetical protein
VVFVLNHHGRRSLFGYLVGDCKDRRFRGCNRFLASSNGDLGVSTVIGTLVDVDLRPSGVLDVVDGRTASPEDTSDRSGGDIEFDDIVRVLFNFKGLRG